MPPIPPWSDPQLVAAAVAVALAALQTLRLWWLRGAAGRALRGRARRGAKGERAAEALLRGQGYEIIARQVCEQLHLRVDGEAVAVDLRADLLVRRGGCTFVAEVKTGDEATQIEHPGTRRQLLEYRHAFDVDGVLLVDVEEARVRLVDFGPAANAAPAVPLLTIRLAWLLAGVGIGYFAAGFGT